MVTNKVSKLWSHADLVLKHRFELMYYYISQFMFYQGNIVSNVLIIAPEPKNPWQIARPKSIVA